MYFDVLARILYGYFIFLKYCQNTRFVLKIRPFFYFFKPDLHEINSISRFPPAWFTLILYSSIFMQNILRLFKSFSCAKLFFLNIYSFVKLSRINTKEWKHVINLFGRNKACAVIKTWLQTSRDRNFGVKFQLLLAFY